MPSPPTRADVGGRSRSVGVGPECHGITIANELRAFADAHCDVVVDFTMADAVRVTLPWLAMHGVHAVVGTTGLERGDVDTLRVTFGEGPAHCLIASNSRSPRC